MAQFRVEFTQVFVQGWLAGITIEDSMAFVDWDAACQWAGTVTMRQSVDYVITNMRGPNGETARF